MLGKLVSALAGRAVAREFGGRRAGPLGAVAGAVLPVVLRRLGPLGMIGAAVGGYAINRYVKSLDRAAPQRTTARFPGGTDPNLTPP